MLGQYMLAVNLEGRGRPWKRTIYASSESGRPWKRTIYASGESDSYNIYIYIYIYIYI